MLLFFNPQKKMPKKMYSFIENHGILFPQKLFISQYSKGC